MSAEMLVVTGGVRGTPSLDRKRLMFPISSERLSDIVLTRRITFEDYVICFIVVGPFPRTDIRQSNKVLESAKKDI